MYRQLEIFLTIVFVVLIFLFLAFIIYRARNIILKRKKRISVWSKEAGWLNRFLKIIMAITIPFLTVGLLYFLFVITLPTSLLTEYLKFFFSLLFSIWMILEFSLCFSISEKLIRGFSYKRILFFIMVLFCLTGAIHFFPLMLKSLPFPSESECVILDLPVRGTWLAGQAGATTITNGHATNRFALDILKLDSDGRFFKKELHTIDDYCSFNEPVYAPADGRVTEVVDTLVSDSLDIMDEKHPGGNYLIIDIGNGKYVSFCHLSKGRIIPCKGQTIKAGMHIGYVGNSGYSTSPHLHMHIQNSPTSGQEDKITYPFRFKEMNRTRFFFTREVRNGNLIRNDRFSN